MSLPSTWRQFQLFDFLPIRDPQYQSTTPLFSDPLLSAITCSQSYIAFAVQNTFITLLAKDLLEYVVLFCAYDPEYRISFMKPLLHLNLLVTMAEKQGSPAIVKVWDLHKITQLPTETLSSGDSMKHKYVTQVQVHDGDNSYPVSCVSFNESLTCVAVGYTNGRVILVRGDLLRDRGSKQRLVYESVDPITGVHFNRFEEVLYVTTISKVLTVLTTGRNQGKPLRVLSSSGGVDLECSDLDYKSLKLIVANTDGFKYYNHVSKAHVINFSIAKRKMLRLFKDYLLVVCPIEETGGSKTLTRLLVLDLHNMHISFSLTIPNLTISHVFSSSSDNNVYLLSTDGVLYKLHEKAINQQVEIVMQRDLFTIALNLANQYSLDKPTLLRINKLHAEYLYDKLDYDNSVAKYIDCLPLFEFDLKKITKDDENIDDFVINVITSFKEVSNVHNMAKFLAKLYDHGLADSDHLTLLLCCYCKLKKVEELDKFIDDLNLDDEGNKSRSEKLDLSKLNFQLIINLFKECGYYPQVTKLLFKLNHPSLIVDIQLNELHQHQNCMSYIRSLPIDDLLRILIEFLKDLLDCMPLDTTELLINVFTGKYKPEASHALFQEPQTPESEDQQPQNTVSSYSAFLSYLSLASPAETEEETEEAEPTYLPPRPSLVFPCFTEHPREFVVFLEACIETFDKFQGNINDKKELLITLFEIYLSMSEEEPAKKDEWIGKARLLMKEHLKLLNKSSSLLLSHIYGFKDGEILAKEDAGFEEAMFRTAQIAGDLPACSQIVHEHGEQRPELYKFMLRFVVSSKEIYKQVTTKDFQFLLEKVKQHRLATPLEVIKILSTNNYATIGIVKDYLIDHVSQTNKEIANNEKLIQSYENESTKNSFRLTELISSPMVMQNNKCSNCALKLDFPLVHFKCKHSYHQRCLNENTYIPEANGLAKCPLCINEYLSVLAVRDSQFHAKDNYALFESQLNDATDRFKVVTDYLGKGVMEVELPQ